LECLLQRQWLTRHQVSQAAISEVVSCCRSVCNQAVNDLKSDIISALNKSGPEGEDLCLALNKDYDPFESIDTNYRFEKFCINNLGCLVSYEHISYTCAVRHVYI